MSGLCTLMERSENLLKISLKDNYIQDDGAKRISTGLQSNFSITQINLTYNLISASLNSEIEAYEEQKMNILINLKNPFHSFFFFLVSLEGIDR